MGYNYELEPAARSKEILLIPDDPLETETYPIDVADIAKMIELYFFYDSDKRFTEDDLIELVELFDKRHP